MLLGSWVLFVDVLPEGGDLIVPWIVIARAEARMHVHTRTHVCRYTCTCTCTHFETVLLRRCYTRLHRSHVLQGQGLH